MGAGSSLDGLTYKSSQFSYMLFVTEICLQVSSFYVFQDLVRLFLVNYSYLGHGDLYS